MDGKDDPLAWVLAGLALLVLGGFVWGWWSVSDSAMLERILR